MRRGPSCSYAFVRCVEYHVTCVYTISRSVFSGRSFGMEHYITNLKCVRIFLRNRVVYNVIALKLRCASTLGIRLLLQHVIV